MYPHGHGWHPGSGGLARFTLGLQTELGFQPEKPGFTFSVCAQSESKPRYFAGAYGAFSEDILYGLLDITIPLYTAYYLVTPWEDLWIWITCSTAGVGLALIETEMVRWVGAPV